MNTERRKKILITAFDVSADHHCADWIAYLNLHHPRQFVFSAFAGERVAQSGVRVIADTTTKSGIGFFSSLKYVPQSLILFFKIKRHLLAHDYDLLLCVDGQGRNLIIGKMAHKLKIKTAYFFPPTVFIFGKNVLKKMKFFDLILCSFAPNYRMYRQAKLPATFIGHPFVYLKQKDLSRADIVSTNTLRKELQLTANQKLIALFPGSRQQEIKRLLPIFLKTITLYQQYSADFFFVIALAHQDFLSLIKKILKQNGKKVIVLKNRDDELLKEADFAICASGTVTLKASFFHLPHVICYKVSPFSYWLAKNFIVYVKYIGMLNILISQSQSLAQSLEVPLVKELLNSELTPENIFNYSLPLIIDAQKRNHHITLLQQATNKLTATDPFLKLTLAIKNLLKE